MTERLYLTVSGNVQIVGYRKEVNKFAIQFNIHGHVMNQKDGTVKIVCEGTKENLDMFHKAILIRNDDIYVDNIRKRSGRATGEFHLFRIQDDVITLGERKLMERLDRGLELTSGLRQDINKGQSETLTAIKTMDSNMGERFDHLDQKQDATIGAIKTMDSNMGQSFSHLDGKYGEFGNTMKSMASDIHAIRLAAVPPRKRIRKQVLKQARSRS